MALTRPTPTRVLYSVSGPEMFWHEADDLAHGVWVHKQNKQLGNTLF